MFNSVIIDVAIGLVLSFLALSLAASAVTEAISSAMKWREASLLDGVKAPLNDPNFTGIARDLYNHALVNPLATGTAKTIQDLTNRPAYIDSRGLRNDRSARVPFRSCHSTVSKGSQYAQ